MLLVEESASGGWCSMLNALKIGDFGSAGRPSCQGWLISWPPARQLIKTRPPFTLPKLNPSCFHSPATPSYIRPSGTNRPKCVAHAAVAKPIDSSQRHLLPRVFLLYGNSHPSSPAYPHSGCPFPTCDDPSPIWAVYIHSSSPSLLR